MEVKIIASGSRGNCYVISDDRSSIMLECGIPLQKIKEGCEFKLSALSGALLSHSHHDHSKSAAALMKAGIDLYCSPDTAEECGLEGYRLHTVPDMVPFTVGSFQIVPFPVHHDVMNYGYFIQAEDGERLLFATDTCYIDYVFPGVTVAMVEANYSEDALAESVHDGRTPGELVHRLHRSHMSVETTVKMLEANNQKHTIKKVYLLHLSEHNSDADEFKRAVQAATGAEVYIA